MICKNLFALLLQMLLLSPFPRCQECRITLFNKRQIKKSFLKADEEFFLKCLLNCFFVLISGFDSQRSRNQMNMKNLQDPNKPQKPDEPNPCLPITTVSVVEAF